MKRHSVPCNLFQFYLILLLFFIPSLSLGYGFFLFLWMNGICFICPEWSGHQKMSIFITHPVRKFQTSVSLHLFSFNPCVHFAWLQVSTSLKIGPIGCPETSVRKCHYSLLNNPEECRSHLRSLHDTILFKTKRDCLYRVLTFKVDRQLSRKYFTSDAIYNGSAGMTLYYYMCRSWQDSCRRGENRSWPSVSVESVDSECWFLNNAIFTLS